MKVKLRLLMLLLFAIGFIPELAFAFNFNWTNPQGDMSIFYLGQIFGPMSTALQGTGSNALIGNLFNIFNIAVLTLGSLVVSYTIVVSTINTAQEGEVMGKKWSSMWIPFRSALGIAFLLPTASGYSLIQIMLMNIIVLGIAAGNQIWQTVINSMQAGTGVFGQVQVDNPQNITMAANGLLSALVCQQVFVSDPKCLASINNAQVTIYTQGNSMYVGVPNSPNLSNLCGSIQAGATPTNAYNASTWVGSNLSAFTATAAVLSGPANQIYTTSDPIGWTSTDVIQTASNTLQGGITSVPLAPPQNPSYYSQQAISNGWIFAGSYYFEIIDQSNNQTITVSSPSFTQGAALGANASNVGISTACLQDLGVYQARITTFLNATNLSAIAQPSGTLQLQQPSIASSTASQFYQALSQPITNLTYELLTALTTNLDDPIASLHRVGADIMSAAETVWFLIITISFFVMILGCIESAVLPPCWAIGAILTVLSGILTLIIGLLWGVGALLGVYLPMVPYLVFTFTALSWLILVVEAIAAAPIIALGLVSPAQEHLGKASPAVLLVANVFLRPSLMVIGFIVAAKLVHTSVNMVNFGFQATVQAAVGALGIFGCIALICLYGALIIGIIHECFSLIHVLPDKIMRWLGGQAETSGVKEKLAEAKGAVEKGAAMGGELMKGTSSFMQEQAKKKMKNQGIQGLGM